MIPCFILHHPAPSACSDSVLFPYFLEYIKSEGTENKEQAQLLKELKKIDEFLGKSDGNFFGGTEINALDLQIAPKLKHIIVGSKAVKVQILPKTTIIPLDAPLDGGHVVVEISFASAKI